MCFKLGGKSISHACFGTLIKIDLVVQNLRVIIGIENAPIPMGRFLIWLPLSINPKKSLALEYSFVPLDLRVNFRNYCNCYSTKHNGVSSKARTKRHDFL